MAITHRHGKKIAALVLGSSLAMGLLVPAASAMAAERAGWISSVHLSSISETFTAKATVRSPVIVEYQFVVVPPRGLPYIARRYSPNSSFTFSAPSSGYQVQVDALTQYQVEHRSWNLKVASNEVSAPFVNAGHILSAPKLTASGPNFVAGAGTPDAGAVYYQFVVKEANGHIFIAQPYSRDFHYTLPPGLWGSAVKVNVLSSDDWAAKRWGAATGSAWTPTGATVVGTPRLTVSNGMVTAQAASSDGTPVYFEFITANSTGTTTLGRPFSSNNAFTLPSAGGPQRVRVLALTQSQWVAGDTGAAVTSSWVSTSPPSKPQIALKSALSDVVVGETPTLTAVLESASGEPLTGAGYGSPEWTVSPGTASLSPLSGTDEASFSAAQPGIYVVTVNWDGVTTSTTMDVKAFTPPVAVSATGLAMLETSVIPPAPGQEPVTVPVSTVPTVTNSIGAIVADAGSYVLDGPQGATGVSIDGATGMVTVQPGASEGRYVITYVQGALQDSTVLTITAGPIAPQMSRVFVPQGAVTAGTMFPVSGVLDDENGNPVADAPVRVAFDGQVASAMTDATGEFHVSITPTVATVDALVSVQAGAGLSVTLSSSGDIGTVVAGQPSLAASGGPAQASIVAGVGDPLTFTFKDAYGNPVVDQPVTFSAQGLSEALYGLTVSSTANGTASLADLGPVLTNSAGQATIVVYDTMARDSGTIEATVSGITETSGMQTVVPGVPSASQSVVTLPASAVVAGQEAVITGTIEDRFGNAIGATSVTVAFDGLTRTVTTNGQGVFRAVLMPTVATSNEPVVVTTGSGTTLTASNDVLSVVPGAPDRADSMVVLSSAVMSAGSPLIVSGTVADQFGNLISGETVNVAFDGEHSSAVTSAGHYEVELIPTALVSNGAVVVTAGSGTVISSGAVGSVVVGDAVSSNTTVVLSSETISAGGTLSVSGTARDIEGYPVSGEAVSVTFDGQSSSVKTNSSGQFDVSVIPTVAALNAPVSVTIGSVTVSDADQVTVVPGSVSTVRSDVGISSSTVTVGAFTTVFGEVEDAYGNPIPSAPVKVNWDGSSYSGTTGANGLFDVSFSPSVVTGSSPVVVSVGQAVISDTLQLSAVDYADPSKSQVSHGAVSSNPADACPMPSAQALASNCSMFNVTVSGDVLNKFGNAITGQDAVVSSDGAVATGSISAGSFQVTLTIKAIAVIGTGGAVMTTYGSQPLVVSVDGVTIYDQDIFVGSSTGSGNYAHAGL